MLSHLIHASESIFVTDFNDPFSSDSDASNISETPPDYDDLPVDQIEMEQKASDLVSEDIDDFRRDSVKYESLLRLYDDWQTPLHDHITIGQCNITWPIDVIQNHRLPPNAYFGFDLHSVHSKRKFLKYWAQELGIWEWLQQIDSGNDNARLQMPDTFKIRANKMIFDDIEMMEDTEKQTLAHMFSEWWINDPGIMSLMDEETQHKFVELGCRIDPQLLAKKNEMIGKIKKWYENKPTVSQYSETTKGSAKLSVPQCEWDHQWYPCSSKYWMDTWRKWMYSDHSTTAVQEAINRFNDIDGIREKHGRCWIPANPWVLHAMHKNIFQLNHINEIHVNGLYQGKQSESKLAFTKTQKWGFDPYRQDIRSMYETPRHFNALTATLDQHINLKKQNPIHIRDSEDEVPRGRIHSCQTRLPRFAIWQFLELLTFVVDQSVPVTQHNVQKTLAVIPGTFIYNPAQCMYGLVTNMVRSDWIIKFVRHASETVSQFQTRITDNWEHIYDANNQIDENIEFELQRELIILPFEYKFQFCQSKVCDHSNVRDQQLFVRLPDQCVSLKHLYRKIVLTDNFLIGSLIVSNVAYFDDPNLPDYKNDVRAFRPRWSWNHVIHNGYSKPPLNFDFIRDELENIRNDFADVWPGKASRDSKIHVFPYKVNADGFNVHTGENSAQGFNSIKEHYISATSTYLVCKTWLISFGVILDDSDGAPFYVSMTEEMLICLFLGILCNKGKNNECLVIAIPTGFIVDGKEVKVLTGIIGSQGDQIDYLTNISRLLSFAERKLIPHRHHSNQISQSVLYLNTCDSLNNPICES